MTAPRPQVRFSPEQRTAIKALVDSGDVLAAQKVILRELTAEFQKK